MAVSRGKPTYGDKRGHDGVRRTLGPPGHDGSDPSERVDVGLENRLVFHALVLVLLAQTHDRTQRLHVVAVALGLAVDVADVVGDRLFLFLEPLDALAAA